MEVAATPGRRLPKGRHPKGEIMRYEVEPVKCRNHIRKFVSLFPFTTLVENDKLASKLLGINEMIEIINERFLKFCQIER